MNKTIIVITAIVIIISIIIFAWFYLFNIYEVKIYVNPKLLNSDLSSTFEIKVIPLNSFGRRALLRNISAKFEIVSGASLVKIVESASDKITLQSLGQLGKVEVLVTPKIGLFPSKIEIGIVAE